MTFTLPKGTHDIFGNEARGYDYIEHVLKDIASTYGFSEMRTPIFEQTELFLRSVGESSDVVRKEMYTFLDKGGRSMTLRPELTAGIMRSIVSNKLYATEPDLPLKAWYLGPIFRYERPQAGRYRQFSQFGIESVGVNSFYSDVEVIMMGFNALKMLGFQNVELRINTLGDAATREAYRLALKEYFKDKISDMCDDCKSRYEVNPLRILDCKVEEDRKYLENAPKLRDFLSEEANEYFENILTCLDDYEIPYVIDDNLVRGLDYYSHVVFEFHYTSKSGKNLGAVGAGGHYSELLHEVGGPHYEGVGLAFGMERIYGLMMEEHLLDEVYETNDISVMALCKEAMPLCFDLTCALRAYGFKVDMLMEPKGIKQQFKRAERKNSDLALIVGEDELAKREVIVRNFKKQIQASVALEDVMNVIQSFFTELEEMENECDDECCCGHHHEHEHDDDECCCGHHHDHEHHHEDGGCCCGQHEHHHHNHESCEGEEHCCSHHKKEN